MSKLSIAVVAAMPGAAGGVCAKLEALVQGAEIASRQLWRH